MVAQLTFDSYLNDSLKLVTICIFARLNQDINLDKSNELF